MRIRRTAAAALVGLLCAGLAACGASPAVERPSPATSTTRSAATSSAAVSSSPNPPSPGPLAVAGPYVALGDSYTAGPGIPDPLGSPAGCRRSSRAYPALLAARLNLAPAAFRNVSCSGARVADLSRAQGTVDGVNPAQLAALGPGTRLVTLGIGGNDIGFADLVARCVRAGLLREAPCRDQLTAGGRDDVEARIRTAGAELAGVLDQIRHRAPRARVYVVGYPAILPADGVSCADSLALTAEDVAYLRVKEQHLNAMLSRRAQAGGAHYVDTWTPSLGHDACEPAATRWIEPLLPSAQAASLHPNARGELGIADAVAAILGDS